MLRHRRYLPPLDADLSLLVLLHDEVYLTQLVVHPLVVQSPLCAALLRTLEGGTQDDLRDLGQVADVLRCVPARVEERRAMGLYIRHPFLDRQDLLEPLLQRLLVPHQVGMLHHCLLDLLLELVRVLAVAPLQRLQYALLLGLDLGGIYLRGVAVGLHVLRSTLAGPTSEDKQVRERVTA